MGDRREVHRLVSSITTTDPRLDRLPRFDVRSRQFPIREFIAPDTAPPSRSRTWRVAPPLDQGREGACTGFSWAAELAAWPVIVGGVDNSFAQRVYQRAKQLDGWPGEDYSGSSVLGAAMAVRELGYMPEFRWAFGVDDLIMAIGHHGPAVIGVNWYDSMMHPRPSGLLEVGGGLAGGHAILVRGVLLRAQLRGERPQPVFRLRNSWGPGWGQGGDCYISVEDMARLLGEQGEVCCPVIRHRAPQPVPEG